MLGTAREKPLFDGGEHAERVAIDWPGRGAKLFEQGVECARIVRLRIAAVGIERLPHALDQRRFTIKCGAVESSPMQCANTRSNGVAQPRGRQFVGQ